MNNLKLGLISILLIQSWLSSAQIAGQVLSSDFKKPVPFAHIYYQDKTIGAVTDINGRFKLSLSGDSVTISAIGFRNSRMATANLDQPVLLDPLITELEEVVVSASSKMEFSPKELVKKALKKAKKIDLDRQLELNIYQYGTSSDQLTRLLDHPSVKVSRKESIPYSVVERPSNQAKTYFESGTHPVGWHLESPYTLLANDIYTIGELKRSKGKYSFKFTGIQRINGQDAFVVSVVHDADTSKKVTVYKTDYKFIFSEDTYELVQYESRELLFFDHGKYEISMLESTKAQYDENSYDPLRYLEINTVQSINKRSANGGVIEQETSEMTTIGTRKDIAVTHPASKLVKVIASKRLIRDEMAGDKLYLAIHWATSEFIHENREYFYQMLEHYDFNQLEIVCIGSPEKKSLWVTNSMWYNFFTHYYLDEPIEKPGTIQLYRGSELLKEVRSIDDGLMKVIKREVNNL
ncbi:MAG: hypothetical protein CMB80_32225 [Flammeovirgaceae bacterium]|nr:hypothetical protein [Flammeovirgaceae bacterium]HCX24354.1 hypothetical protein [Cytophagales bacterium]|tara:strand:+ start:851 stop:2242 length:1392 start_codon:yes stop_codon:yes gene_type:complete